MKKTRNQFVMRAMVAAVGGAFAAAVIPAASADEEDVRQLTQPTSTVEVGAGHVNKDSRKFGEYNGLEEKGFFGIGNFDLRGGGRYDSDNATRWRATGSNLGLDTRNIRGEFGVQGNFRFSGGYDEIIKNSTTFQTIYDGGGGTALTLPAGYPAAATRGATWNNIQNAAPAAVIPGLLHSFEPSTKRKTLDLGGEKLLGGGWAVSASARHQEKDGTRMLGANMNRFTGPHSFVPEPIDYTTDTVEASARYATRQMHVNFGYSGSFFKNDVNLWTVEYPGANAALTGNTAHFTSAPDNQAHQFTLAGGYNFSSTTRAVVSASYGRMTQDETFPYIAPNWILPATSANAKVNNTQLLARLTTRPMANLGLNASYKYDNRENKTPSQAWLVTPDTPVTPTLFTNHPIDRKQHQVNLDADYSLGLGQAVGAGYEWQQIKRESHMIRAEKVNENTVRAEYRRSFDSNVTGRVAYAYSQRRYHEYEENELFPVQEFPPLGYAGPGAAFVNAANSAPFPAADPLLPGFRQFWLADRNRDKIRSSVSFQPTNLLSLQGAFDLNRDKYPHSQFGLKEGRSWALNLDSTYTPTDTFSINTFYTYEDEKQRMQSRLIPRVVNNSENPRTATAAPTAFAHTACASYTQAANTFPADVLTDPCRDWGQTQQDKIHTLGVGFTSKGWVANRVTLTGGMALSRATTSIPMTGGAYFSVGGTPALNVFFPAESFPNIKQNMIDLRLAATYDLNKRSAVRGSWWYRRLRTEDWQYDAYTNSSLGALAIPSYIGPQISSPDYDVQVVGLTYIYKFQ